MNASLTVLATTFDKPHLEYSKLWPLFVVFGVACVGVLVEAFAPRERRYLLQTVLTLAGLVAALVGTCLVAADLDSLGGGVARGLIAAEGTIVMDGPTARPSTWRNCISLRVVTCSKR